MRDAPESFSAAGAPLPARVLLVDDQPANLLALEGILAPLGLELVRATSGEEALRRLLDGDFACILLDVQMPGLDGFQVAGIIKSRPRTQHIPIIFVTALSREASHVFQGYETGAVDYLLKPLNPDILRSKVAVFVELYRKTEQVKRQQALLHLQEREAFERRSELRFRSLTDALPLALWAVRADGTVAYANRNAERYQLGGGRALVEGSAGAIHPDDVQPVADAWRHAEQTGAPSEYLFRLRRAGEEHYRWHLCRVVPEHDEEGARTGWIATATDIDDQKRSEEALQQISLREQHAREAAEQARHTAETANRAKDEFLATVSHELRTPLTAILGWASMLRQGRCDTAKWSHAAQVIERNARAQKDLIEDLLDMSRIITGKLQLRVGQVDPRHVIEAAMESVRPAAEAKGIRLSLDVGDVPAGFLADPERLQQIVWNLLANAIKFTPAQGAVDVRLDGGPQATRIRVHDSGCGIDHAFLPFVFDRFRQADGTNTRTNGGLGLGLAIVRHLVELHGGTVRAESEGEGKGATFVVELPVRAHVQPSQPLAPATDGVVRPEQGAPQRLENLKVLLVEDDADGREMLTMMLEELGAQVQAVSTAAEALELLRRVRPDVLVSDIGLPHEDGYSLVRRVRALDPASGGRTPAAALSAYATALDRSRALEAGFQAHVPKPVEPQRLAALIADLARDASVH